MENNEVLAKLVNNSFGIVVNANDFFCFACAASMLIDPLDLPWVLRYYRKYGHAGLNACMSYIAKADPIEVHKTDTYILAKNKLNAEKPIVHSEW